MKKDLQYSKLVGIFLLIADFILIDLSCKAAYVMRFGIEIGFFEYYVNFVLVFKIAWILAWLAIVLLNNVNILRNLFTTKELLANLFYAFLLHALILFAYMVSFKAHEFSRIFLFYAYGISIAIILLFRVIFAMFLKYVIRLGQNDRKVIIVGAGYAGNELYHYLISTKSKGYKFLGFFDDAPELTNLMIKGKLKHIKDYCLDEGVNEIYYSLPLNNTELIKDLADFCDENFIYFKLAPDFRGLVQRKVNIDFYENIPIMTFRREPLQVMVNRMMKRSFDIAFSLLVILLIFPFVYPIIALFIKLDSQGPVLFKQPRSGKKNKMFLCYKFRTMYVNNEANAKQASKGDSRITKVGAFLRKTSLDELPQFFNVLLGHMSVVGPRPHMLKHTEEYSKMIEKYLVRHFITPGITGYAQVNGFRGETNDSLKMKKRLEYDTWYIENWSFLLDIKIIFMTVMNMIKGEENAF